MVTGPRARSYEEMVEALAEEGLPALQGKLSELTPEDWERPTLLQPPEPGKPPWTVLQEVGRSSSLPTHAPADRGPLPPRQAAAQLSPALAAPVARWLPAGSFAVAARLLPDDLAPDD
jgi:hypothetical protein